MPIYINPIGEVKQEYYDFSYNNLQNYIYKHTASSINDYNDYFRYLEMERLFNENYDGVKSVIDTQRVVSM